jgi:hypothetical protein
MIPQESKKNPLYNHWLINCPPRKIYAPTFIVSLEIDIIVELTTLYLCTLLLTTPARRDKKKKTHLDIPALLAPELNKN